MGHILLHEQNAAQSKFLVAELEARGHRVSVLRRLAGEWQMQQIHFDLAVFDLDGADIASVCKFVDGLAGVSVLVQTSALDLALDFRSWFADAIVYKSEDRINLLQAMAQHLEVMT